MSYETHDIGLTTLLRWPGGRRSDGKATLAAANAIETAVVAGRLAA